MHETDPWPERRARFVTQEWHDHINTGLRLIGEISDNDSVCQRARYAHATDYAGTLAMLEELGALPGDPAYHLISNLKHTTHLCASFTHSSSSSAARQ